jgi:hypothetical protein
MNQLSTILAILSAMIAPAVLISACGSLILTTSQRLSRTLDRTRSIFEQFEDTIRSSTEDSLVKEEQALSFKLLDLAAKRSRLLQRALSFLYLSLSVFVATSVALGVFALLPQNNIIQKYVWFPIMLAMIGTGLLLYSSCLLIIESHIALVGINTETDFVIRLSQSQAPASLLKSRKRRRNRRFIF